MVSALACGLPFVHRVFKLKRIFRVSYQTVLRRLIENRKEKGHHDAYSRVYKIWNQAHFHHFGTVIESKKEEPPPLDPGAFSKVFRAQETEHLATSDFLEEGLQRLARMAYEKDKITLSRLAEYLQISLSDARALAGQWQEERSLGI